MWFCSYQESSHSNDFAKAETHRQIIGHTALQLRVVATIGHKSSAVFSIVALHQI